MEAADLAGLHTALFVRSTSEDSAVDYLSPPCDEHAPCVPAELVIHPSLHSAVLLSFPPPHPASTDSKNGSAANFIIIFIIVVAGKFS